MSVIGSFVVKYVTILYNLVYFACGIHDDHEIFVYKIWLYNNDGSILSTFIKRILKAKEPFPSHEVNRTVMQMKKNLMMMMMMMMMKMMSCSGE